MPQPVEALPGADGAIYTREASIRLTQIVARNNATLAEAGADAFASAGYLPFGGQAKLPLQWNSATGLSATRSN